MKKEDQKKEKEKKDNELTEQEKEAAIKKLEEDLEDCC